MTVSGDGADIGADLIQDRGEERSPLVGGDLLERKVLTGGENGFMRVPPPIVFALMTRHGQSDDVTPGTCPVVLRSGQSGQMIGPVVEKGEEDLHGSNGRSLFRSDKVNDSEGDGLA